MKNDAIYYWDTSALLPFLLEEKESQKLREWASKKKAFPAYTSTLTRIETESALQRRVRERSLDPADLMEVRFRAEVLSKGLARMPLDDALAETGQQMVLLYGLRPGDAVQLASATRLKQAAGSAPVFFVTLDSKLASAARAAGFSVF